MHKLTLITLPLLLFSQAISWAEQNEDAIFKFSREPMLANYGQAVMATDAVDQPMFSEVPEGLTRLNLNNYNIQMVLHDQNLKIIQFAEFQLQSLLNYQLEDSLQPPTVGNQGPLAGVPLLELSITEDSQGVKNITVRLGAKGEGSLALIVDKQGATGLIQHNDVVYNIKPMYNKWHAFSTPTEQVSARIYDADVVIPEEPNADHRGGVESDDVLEDSSCDVSSGDVETIDLVVAYTPRAEKEALGQVANIETQIKLATLVSNEAFKTVG